MPPPLFPEASGHLSPGTNLAGIVSEGEELYSVFRARVELMSWRPVQRPVQAVIHHTPRALADPARALGNSVRYRIDPPLVPGQVSLPDRAVAVVHAEDSVVRRDGYALGVGENPVSPGAQQLPMGLEHDHRYGPAVEDVDLVLGVDGDGRSLPVDAPFGKLAPVLARDPVVEAVLTDHNRPALFTFGPVSLGAQAVFPVLFLVDHPPDLLESVPAGAAP